MKPVQSQEASSYPRMMSRHAKCRTTSGRWKGHSFLQQQVRPHQSSFIYFFFLFSSSSLHPLHRYPILQHPQQHSLYEQHTYQILGSNVSITVTQSSPFWFTEAHCRLADPATTPTTDTMKSMIAILALAASSQALVARDSLMPRDGSWYLSPPYTLHYALINTHFTVASASPPTEAQVDQSGNSLMARTESVRVDCLSESTVLTAMEVRLTSTS